ncbi:hypothetical protein L211DRAFT_839671, partial [Terfezia boudieri ATCC MYA-4762]
IEAIHERQRGVWVLRIISIGTSKSYWRPPRREGYRGESSFGALLLAVYNLVILGAAALEAILT